MVLVDGWAVRCSTCYAVQVPLLYACYAVFEVQSLWWRCRNVVRAFLFIVGCVRVCMRDV